MIIANGRALACSLGHSIAHSSLAHRPPLLPTTVPLHPRAIFGDLPRVDKPNWRKDASKTPFVKEQRHCRVRMASLSMMGVAARASKREQQRMEDGEERSAKALKTAWNSQRLRIPDQVAVNAGENADVCMHYAHPGKQYSTHGISQNAWKQVGQRSATRTGIDGTLYSLAAAFATDRDWTCVGIIVYIFKETLAILRFGQSSPRLDGSISNVTI